MRQRNAARAAQSQLRALQWSLANSSDARTESLAVDPHSVLPPVAESVDGAASGTLDTLSEAGSAEAFSGWRYVVLFLCR